MSVNLAQTLRVMATAALIVGSVLALPVAQAQQTGIKRTDLQRHDLGVPGREAVQVRVDIDPGL
jgi:hypothetical protein